MRVFAVAQILHFYVARVELRWVGQTHGLVLQPLAGVDGRQIVADGAVVLADAIKRRHRQGKACIWADLALRTPLGEQAGILRGVGEHRHIAPVFGRAAHHGRATDVDVFDRVFQRAVGACHRGFKRIKVHHQHVDGVNALLGQGLHVGGHIAPRQQTAVHVGMQRFDAAIEHFGKTRAFGDLGHGQAGLGQQACGTAGGDQAHTKCVQPLGQFDYTGFVGYRNQCLHGRYAPRVGAKK